MRELLGAGHEVTILHRKARRVFAGRVEQIVADRNDPAAVKAAAKGRKFGAVFDNVYDWARGTAAEQVEGTARALAHKGLKRYIFTSTVAVYGDGALGCRETRALAPGDARNPYQRNKAESERALFRMHKKEGLPTVTLRPPFVYGPENMFYREQFFWDRMRLGRKIVLPGGGRTLMHMVYVKDLVRAMVEALTNEAAVGQAFNVAGDAPVTQKALVRELARAGGYTAGTVSVPRTVLRAKGANPYAPPFYFGEYFDLPPITEDITKARKRLGYVPTPLGEGLAETHGWYLKSHKPVVDGFEFEDSLMAEAK